MVWYKGTISRTHQPSHRHSTIFSYKFKDLLQITLSNKMFKWYLETIRIIIFFILFSPELYKITLIYKTPPYFRPIGWVDYLPFHCRYPKLKQKPIDRVLVFWYEIGCKPRVIPSTEIILLIRKRAII